MDKKKKLVVLTGAGMSAESGFSTFRDNGGLWERYSVERVASHEGWLREPDFVNGFYNGLRRQLVDASPNGGHLALAALEDSWDVTVVTQNVDDLHERAGSSRVVHLHGELMKVCSSRDPEDLRCLKTLSAPDLDVAPGQLAADGSLLRPYIVFFGEAVPKLEEAAAAVSAADAFAVIGSSLVVYPAAGLVRYVPREAPCFLIDPKEVSVPAVRHFEVIQDVASSGTEELARRLARLL